MIWRILGHYFMSEKTRIKIITNLLIESALIREDDVVEIKVTVNDMTAERVIYKQVDPGRWEATLGKNDDD